MAQKPTSGKIQLPQKVTLGISEPRAITGQQIELEGCSNPPKVGKLL